MVLLKDLYQNDWFLGNGGPSKIKIQYVSLMKHFRFIDVNRSVGSSIFFISSTMKLTHLTFNLDTINVSVVRKFNSWIIFAILTFFQSNETKWSILSHSVKASMTKIEQGQGTIGYQTTLKWPLMQDILCNFPLFAL